MAAAQGGPGKSWETEGAFGGFFARKAGQKRPISLDSFQGLQEHVQEPDAPMSGR